MEKLKGTLRGVRFSGKNFWSVASLEPVGANANLGLVTVVGSLIACEIGDSLELHGEWVEDKKYGQQFKFRRVETLTPCDHEGVVAWLTRLPDVGRSRAIDIVKAIGADKIWDVLEHSPHQLTAISGITIDRANAIRDAYLSRRDERDQMVFLKRWGLTDWQCARIIGEYRHKAEQVMRDNPYQLTRIDGFGFKTVDAIALKLGVTRDHIERAKAAVLHMLDIARGIGHTYVPIKSLVKRCIADLEVPGKRVREAVALLDKSSDVVTSISSDGDITNVSLRKLYTAEMQIAHRLTALLRGQRTA